MTYIKINKPSLDYHHFSDFHVFTMNNFVRNVMQNGKYKKAVRLVRLGLIRGLKELRWKLKQRHDQGVFYNYEYLPRTSFNEETKKKLLSKLNVKELRYQMNSVTGDKVIKQLEPTLLDDDRVLYYKEVSDLVSSFSNFSFFEFFNSLLVRKKVNKKFPQNFKDIKYCTDHQGEINQNDINPIDKLNYQYNMFEQLDFKKLYTKKPAMLYYGFRDLTHFDMVIQVYTMLTGVWYMRKAKVSGRTVLIPSPLRPYRRITTVTKMLLKGIRARRKEERYYKNAMIRSIGTEFYWLLYYNGIQYSNIPNSITNSKVWLAKMDSHKELVYHLKNIKHLKYF